MEIRERLRAVATELNETIAKGKVRQIRKVLERHHTIVWEAIKEIESQPVVDRALLEDAEALFMDIRSGQPTVRFT